MAGVYKEMLMKGGHPKETVPGARKETMKDYNAIEIKDISKIYKLFARPKDRLKESLSLTHKCYHTDHFALAGVNLEVKKGEAVGIIGTNGSGKSTLLKIITGVLNPSGGSVEIDGKISALLELGAGFNMEYTGIENIYLNGTMMGFTDEEMEAKMDDIISFAEIGEFVHQPVKTYSSGMFARLAFAVAINVEPDILIVDEALSVGDIFFQAKCYRKFTEFKEAGKTIIFVSHDMGSVIKYCDRALLLNKGKQVFVGPCSQAVDIYKKILANQFHEEDLEQLTVNGDSGQASGSGTGAKEQLQSAEISGTVANGNDAGADANGVAADGKKAQGGKEVAPNWKSQLILNSNLVEYGEKEGEIIDFALMDHKGMITSSLDKGEKFQIKMKIRFNQDIDHPIFAYTIKDRKGTEITGTNTVLEGNNLEKAVKGQEVVVCFTQDMDLQSGQYLLSLGCTGYRMDQLVIYHRLYDACFMEVFSTKDTVGYFDMNAAVSYEE